MDEGSGFLLTANQAYRDERFGKGNNTWARLASTQINNPDEYSEFRTAAGCCVTETDVLPEKNWIAFVATPLLRATATHT
jgi:hypothetical protein